MSPRSPRFLAALVLLLAAGRCATTAPAPRTFPPATPADASEALTSWSAARERAATLPPSRLLYDAKLSTSGTPSVSGTLAVTYDGKAVVAASLTGPFGSHIAEYRGGTITGEDRKALVVDPEALRAVLAGVWNGSSPIVAGRDGGECLLSWQGTDGRVEAVLDLSSGAVVSMEFSRGTEALDIRYSGAREPWPAGVAVRDASTGRGLALRLVAIEPAEGGSASRP